MQTTTFAATLIPDATRTLAALLLFAVACMPLAAATVDQPAPFSHRHHVSALGLDCRGCHATVDISANAGMPDNATCTNCHTQLVAGRVNTTTADAGALAPARAARLPDFVYFDHSVHSARGVSCAACHGDVEQKPLASHTLTTGWCADCHRHPERIASRIGRSTLAPRAMLASVGRATRNGAAPAACKLHLDAALDRCNLLLQLVFSTGM